MMPKTMESIEAQLKEIVFCARQGDYADAASKLNTSLQAIQPVLLSGKIDPAHLHKLSYSLETLCMMQQQNDWVAVADVMEYEFIPLYNNSLGIIDKQPLTT